MMNDILRNSVFRLYRAGQLTDAGLDNAVEKGWITSEDAETLKAERAE